MPQALKLQLLLHLLLRELPHRAASRKGRGDPPRAWQRMLSGRRLDLLDPSPLDIEIEDIAHGLARVARWNGQTQGEHAFSVAEDVQRTSKVSTLCSTTSTCAFAIASTTSRVGPITRIAFRGQSATKVRSRLFSHLKLLMLLMLLMIPATVLLVIPATARRCASAILHRLY
jgi:hypothetical protein